ILREHVLQFGLEGLSRLAPHTGRIGQGSPRGLGGRRVAGLWLSHAKSTPMGSDRIRPNPYTTGARPARDLGPSPPTAPPLVHPARHATPPNWFGRTRRHGRTSSPGASASLASLADARGSRDDRICSRGGVHRPDGPTRRRFRGLDGL